MSSASVDARAALARLYREDHGYESDPLGEARVVEAGSSPTYGEMLPAATNHLLRYLQLGPKDVFYDLGSGVGKVILQTAMTVPVASCVGIELMRSRHRIAQRLIGRARSEGLLQAADCRARNSDFMRARLGDATVVYSCSTAFPTDLMMGLAARLARLPIGLRLVSTQELEDNDWFSLEDVLHLDMSWHRRSKVHAYRLVRRRWR